MRCLPSEKLVAYTGFVVVGLFAALLTHRVELALLVAPFAVGLAAGVAWARRPFLEVTARLSENRVIEGDEPELAFEVVATRGLGRVDLVARLPAPLLGSRSPAASVLVERAGSHRCEIPLAAPRPGTFEVGPIAWRVQDPGRLLQYEGVVDVLLELRVHPRPEHVARLLQPTRTTPFGGLHRARAAGGGIEFAEARPFLPGDRIADVNARVSARRGEPYVTLRHPERHANVVVLVDTSTPSPLESVVRAAAALVSAYGRAGDRVGVVAFGSMLRWVPPGLGGRHLYRVLDALLTSESPFSYVWRDLRSVPAAMLPPNALVWLVSPLEDDRPAGVVLQLRSRGFDVSILEVALEDRTPPGAGREGRLAHELWRQRRAARRAALLGCGTPVVAWDGERSIGSVAEEAAAFHDRRRQRAR